MNRLCITCNQEYVLGDRATDMGCCSHKCVEILVDEQYEQSIKEERKCIYCHKLYIYTYDEDTTYEDCFCSRACEQNYNTKIDNLDI
jgi:hypothetical protein